MMYLHLSGQASLMRVQQDMENYSRGYISDENMLLSIVILAAVSIIGLVLLLNLLQGKEK